MVKDLNPLQSCVDKVVELFAHAEVMTEQLPIHLFPIEKKNPLQNKYSTISQLYVGPDSFIRS